MFVQSLLKHHSIGFSLSFLIVHVSIARAVGYGGIQLTVNSAYQVAKLKDKE